MQAKSKDTIPATAGDLPPTADLLTRIEAALSRTSTDLDRASPWRAGLLPSMARTIAMMPSGTRELSNKEHLSSSNATKKLTNVKLIT